MTETIWNNCLLIYDGEKFIGNVNTVMSMAYQNYAEQVGKIPEKKVWYDVDSKICFGAEQTFFHNPGDFSFFNSEDRFLKEDPPPYSRWEKGSWGRVHVYEKLGQYLGSDVVESSEHIIQNKEYLKKYVGKKILIVGAGPTTNEIEWDANNYDYVWSCTNFFLHPKLSELNLDLVSVGGDVDIADEKLIDYLKKNSTICAFEGGVSPFKTGEELEEFKNQFPNRSLYFHLRYFSKIGSGPRLLVLATILGAKEVHFVGVDGHPIGHEHVFEGEDKEHHGAPLLPDAYNLFRRQFVLLWDYLLNNINGNKTKYQNLGEGHAANQSTDISQQEFPLER